MELRTVVLSALKADGLLLTQDRTLPSVVGIVTGESLRTSWWGHPKGRLIFGILSELADHPDVLFTKLIAGKSTLVDRSLWPALLAVARTRAEWQIERLSAGARQLLERVDRDARPVRAAGPNVQDLERRLLVITREVHTEAGRHETALESWRAWSRRVGCKALRSLPRARSTLEDAASGIGATPDALPWPGKVRRPKRSSR